MVLGHSIAFATNRVVAPIEGMHLSIAKGWFGATGPPGRVARAIHDSVASGVYGSVRIGAAVLGDAISYGTSPDSPISMKGRAIVNGLWGDDLGRYSSAVETSMEIRSSSGDVIADGSGQVGPLSDATSHIVVLVHGLFEYENCWRGDTSDPGLMEVLEGRPHLTLLNVRYNSGRVVADNGEQLAGLLDILCDIWPVRIASIALVGNSMGGLLIRSACSVAEQKGQSWLEDVRNIVTVATPHHGTPIEKGVDLVASLLSVASSTRPLGIFLDSRSRGIKDLGDGSISTSEYQHASNIDDHCIAAVITADPASPVGAALGDLVVQPASASRGKPRHSKSATVIGGTSHFAALGNAKVIESVAKRVDPARI
jgi:pimeloyl-ACP methyl ester carboxylesterase